MFRNPKLSLPDTLLQQGPLISYLDGPLSLPASMLWKDVAQQITQIAANPLFEPRSKVPVFVELMSEYLSSLFEPVVRQARRFSRVSTGEKPPRFLPAVPESLRTWYPTRLWNTSPPASSSEDENQDDDYTNPDSTLAKQWATLMPSPPLDAMDSGEHDGPGEERRNAPTPAPFPPLEPQVVARPRPARLGEVRASSDSSINPLWELPDRSRIHEEDVRGHSQSDPLARVRTGSGAGARRLISTGRVRAYYENDRQSRSRDGSGTLPEDDGMGPLRQKINAIWQGEGTVESKSQMLHSVMMERYNASRLRAQAAALPPKGGPTSSRPLTPSSLRDVDDGRSGSPMSLDSGGVGTSFCQLSPADMRATYAPLDQEDASTDGQGMQAEDTTPQLGCMHYKRNVKLQCHTCKRWYTCRFCHDEVEDHILPRQQTENMLCMLCKTAQSASQTCKLCGKQSSCYYCPVCKLWNNDPAKSIYHCDDCGICRLGEGLGKDFFHCPTCAVCMSIGVEFTHRCIERSTKCDCPICGDYLFTSSGTVVFMRCGHSIHDSCFKEWCRASYKCPICSKSVMNMESQFRSLDRQIESQPMPEEYENTRAYVYCNDCSRKGTTRYHWLGLKCETCESYNTQQHHLIEVDGSTSRPRSAGSQHHHELEAPVNASPPLPQNVSDEAVAIPNSAAASRRPSTTLSEMDLPSATTLPRLLLPPREARSLSPTVGNYFGTTARQGGLEYDFWGRPVESLGYDPIRSYEGRTETHDDKGEFRLDEHDDNIEDDDRNDDDEMKVDKDEGEDDKMA